MNIRDVIEDKEEVLNQAFTLIEKAIEDDPKYTLGDDERAELVWSMMYIYGGGSDLN